MSAAAVAVDQLPSETIGQQRDAYVERMFKAAAGVFEIFTVHIGHRLGYYRALAGAGALTAPELAARTGTHERYAREWLEQQAVIGVLRVDSEEAPAEQRRFSLPPGHAIVLTEADSLEYLAPFAQTLVGAVKPIDAIIEAFQTGRGVPFGDYGEDARCGIGDMNRPMYMKLIGTEWIPAMPDVHARLQADPPARVADVGCGSGWSSLAFARAYPNVRVDGFDMDAPSIEMARRHAIETGLADRVSFHCRDASHPDLTGTCDLVTAFECIHDMSNPVGALEAMRALAGDGGAVLVVDERVRDRFSTDRSDDLEWLMYGFSVLHCLPAGMAETPSAATGTVMRTDTLRQYATQAGFRDVEVLPVDHTLFRFYRLHP